jgi:acyl carrier protein
MSEKIETELRNLLDELGLAKADDGATDDVAFADLELDSLTLMDICVSLEDRYDLIIEPADVVKQGSLRNLALFIAARRPERA